MPPRPAPPDAIVQPDPNGVPTRLPVGIPGYTLHEETRSVPAGQPPVLSTNDKLEYIGKSTLRWDAAAKATGRARYTSDVQLPGMLHARLVTANIPHAHVLSVDTSAAEKLSGVRAVSVFQKILDVAILRDPSLEPVKYPVVRFAGQPIAAVAATTPEIAAEAADLIEVKYEPLPFVVDEFEARKSTAPLVFPGAADQAGTAGGGGGASGLQQTGNIHGPAVHTLGDAATAMHTAATVVEAHYTTQVQTHSAMETHGVVADWRPEMLTIYSSTQGIASVRDEMAAFFNLPKSQVRVICEYMGGGFGAKFGAGNYGVAAAALSKKAGAPVRLMLDRSQEHLSVGNRPSSDQQLRIGANADGTLAAIELTSFGTAGCGTGAGCARPAANQYKMGALRTEESDVFTNAGPSAAFRAPGHPQGAFALEQSIDELAERLKLDPFELRERIDVNPARRVERIKARAHAIWRSRSPKPNTDAGPVKRGVGMAQSVWYRHVNRNSAAEVRVHRDGSVEVLSAVQDLGTGIKTVLAQIVAEQFGVEPAAVAVKVGDSNYPIGPNSGGSTTTSSLTPAVRDACWQAAQKFLAAVAPALARKAEDLTLLSGKICSTDGKMTPLPFRAAAAKMNTDGISAQTRRIADYDNKLYDTIGGITLAEVLVDTETGRIHVPRVYSVHDCGRPMNPRQAISQIHGGILQGISYALFEQRLLDPNYGLMVNDNLDKYKIAGSREVPQIEVELIETYLGQSSTDAGGLAEAAGVISIVPALANAFYNATGARLRRLPMTPAEVWAALNPPQPVKYGGTA